MKTKIYDARASQDITIDELPKQDNPNNSDLLVVQSSSLTEATSIQQLRNKILSGSESISANLGEYVFSSALIENNSLHLMDGSVAYKDQYQEFYAWLLLQADSVKQFYLLDTVAESFIFPLINNRNLKINSAITTYTGGIAQAMTNHTHRVEGEYNNSFWLTQQQTPPNLTSQRRVMVQMDSNYLAKTTTARDSAGINALASGEQAYISSYMYVRVSSASNILASKSILANGTISMDLDYQPTDPLDVATKKYIDNKFLNYEIPLSFSINDIGKRIPYYKNAETNPVLIALDGTKYLIADYPDFDYENQEGFTNDGVYFWFANIELEIKNFQNDIQPSSEWFKLPVYTSKAPGGTLQGNFEFYSKMIYNFLQSPQGAPYLFANATDNAGFTILDPTTYKIRANYNNWGSNTDFPNLDVVHKVKLSLPAIVDRTTSPYSIGFVQTASTSTSALGVTGEVSYLKIKPDYMVAKIQQVGSVAGTGDLKADRSVLLTGAGTFNTKQVASMDDLKDTNIIVGNSARVLVTLDTKLVEVDNSISTINNNIGSVDISGLQAQVNTNTSDITNIKTVNTNQDTSITTLQNQVNSLLNKLANCFASTRKLNQQNTTNKTLAGQASLRVFDLCNITTSVDLDSTSFMKEGTTNSVIKELNMINNYQRQLNIALTIGHNAQLSGKKIELEVLLKRGDGTVVRGGNSMMYYDTQTRLQTSTMITVTLNSNDSFVTQGYYLEVKNLNPSAEILTYSTIEILMNVVQLPKLGA